MPTQTLNFPPFSIDPDDRCLWRGNKRLPLTPKDFAVLYFLAVHPGRLVTQKELLAAVWGDTVVSAGIVKVRLRRIRRALDDHADKPKFIETVHGLGYRFIAPVSRTSAVQSLESGVHPRTGPHAAPEFVGRERELAYLQSPLGKALEGKRRLVFVLGEAGIGKTSLVETFLAQFVVAQDILITRCQCVERYSAGEAYRPVLEALGRLCRGPIGKRVMALLRRYAPTWLVQMPGLLSAAEQTKLQRAVSGATQTRMLREMIEAIEALTAERALIVWFEDLQWCDVSTLEWLSAIAWRQENARLLVLATCRPVEALEQGHPLRAILQELILHRYSTELCLKGLSTVDIARYLASRLPPRADATLLALAATLQRRTEGNPLFLVNIVDHLLAQGVLREGNLEDEAVEESIPETLRQMIERQLERLNPEAQRLLEIASVARMEFSAAALTVCLQTTVQEVEQRCAALARHGLFIQTNGLAEWPDGTTAARYRFLHSLYQQVLYEGITPSRRIELHRLIGERKETGYGERSGEIAAELAIHFEQGRDDRRAIRYRRQAGANAMHRSAQAEAMAHFHKALALLKTFPDTAERSQQELELQLALGAPLLRTKGYIAPEVQRTYDRAYVLCQQLGEGLHLFPALFGLFRFYLNRGDLLTARKLAERLLALAQAGAEPVLLPAAGAALGAVLFHRGDLASARAQVEQGLMAYDRRQHGLLITQYGEDPGVICLHFALWSLQALGYPDQALAKSRETRALVQELSHPFTRAKQHVAEAFLFQYRREAPATQAQAEAAIAILTEPGVGPDWLAIKTVLRGWALAEQGRVEEGIAQVCQGIETLQTRGFFMGQPYLLGLLAEAYQNAGAIEKGLTTVDQALSLVEQTGQRLYEAELYRIKGQLILRFLPDARAETEAEACFHQAIERARRHQARLWELRAVTSLARLWRQQGKQVEARRMLTEIYDGFTEGYDTIDLKEAKALLEEPVVPVNGHDIR
jgi:DNA-binding winged helix-turn-helix (wHTH) protein/predicted ATPase